LFSVVKLLKNWRSHPSILDYPNGNFYNDELEPCGDPVVTHSLLRWDGLGEKNFPVIFHAIAGAPVTFQLYEFGLIELNF
jgi:helicase MOV-10